MSTADPELEVTLRRVEAQEARARRRMLAVTAVLIVLGIAFLAVIGRSIIAGRREVTAKGEQLTKANAELALYTQPMTQLRGDLDQLTSARDEKWDRLTASLADAENMQNQLARNDEVYAGNLAEAEQNSQSFNREMDAKIAEINQRIDGLRSGQDDYQAPTNSNPPPRQRDPRASREEAHAREDLINLLKKQRQMLQEVLNRSRKYQSTMAALRGRLNQSLVASKQAHAELGITDKRIGNVCRLATGKDAAGR